MDNHSQISTFQNNSAPKHPGKIDLESGQIEMIEEALSSLGQFGEVRLIVEKGRLRFLVVQKSVDVFKWRPGNLSGQRD